jgi:hypothetical protein
MIKVNKKIKFILVGISSFSLSLCGINFYNKKFTEFSIDLNKIVEKNKNSTGVIVKPNVSKDEDNNPFQILNEFTTIEDYYLNKMIIILYTPPLTNKLFPKSNLYGHELIRYFDL